MNELPKVGAKVTYRKNSKVEKGIVKNWHHHGEQVFVVYHCDDDWDNFKNYTSALTPIKDLTLGWDE